MWVLLLMLELRQAQWWGLVLEWLVPLWVSRRFHMR